MTLKTKNYKVVGSTPPTSRKLKSPIRKLWFELHRLTPIVSNKFPIEPKFNERFKLKFLVKQGKYVELVKERNPVFK